MSGNVYAEFGVTNATFGSVEDLEAHQQEMLKADVAVRDGDDAITLKQDEEVDHESGDKDEDQQDEEFKSIGDTPKELTESVEALSDNEAAFDDMVSSAIEAGKVSQDDITAIKAEYESGGKLSEASYAKLQEAGYSKRFVDSFIKGQEAIAEQYANQVVRMAGGVDKFNSILSTLEANDKSTKEALESAIVRKDISTVKAILNLAGKTLSKTRGVQPARTVTTQGKPQVTRQAETTVEGFKSTAEMVKAMRDPRYLRDASYTEEVRQKVGVSKF